MRVLRGTLTFVLGMIIGIILFVLSIGGTVLILATRVTVGNIQSSVIGSEIISPDSQIYEKSVLDAVKGVLSDVQNFDKLSLKTLYDHYGISIINGVSGIDFTDKDFYDVPISELVNDLSIVVNSFTLRDVSKIAGVDFESYNLPVLLDNLDNSVSKAVDNILGAINGDLSIRTIKDSIGIDLGLDDNSLLSTIQYIALSSFGSLIDALRLNVLLNADTDTFIPTAGIEYYAKADIFEKVSAADLANANYVAPLGVETYLAGGIDTDGNGTMETMDIRELRFVKKTSTVDGEQTESYVVDNSCYSESFDIAENEKTFYRHIEYVKSNAEDGERYIMSYANHIESTDGTSYTLVQKGFIPEDEAVSDGDALWGIFGEVDKDSKLDELDDTLSVSYKRVHVGSSMPILQKIVYMTVGELRNADSLLDSLTVADIIEINEDSAKILRSLAARKTKIKQLGSVAGTLPLGEIIDIKTSPYVESRNGRYVRIVDENTYMLYTEGESEGLTRYKKNADGTYTPDDKGAFVHSVYYTLYNAAEHTDLVRYDRAEGEASSIILQRFTGATLNDFSSALSNLMLSDVMQIDGDVYAVADKEHIDTHPDERYFYYDEEKRIYKVANEEYRAEHTDITYYHVTISGNSTSFLKKLAFVHVDNLSAAMETLIDDLMISEILDVYTLNALKLSPTENTGFVEGGEYLLEYDENAAYCGVDDYGKYVYSYDERGSYARSNFLFTLLPKEDINGYSEGDSTKYIYYTYKSFAQLWDELGGNNEEFTKKAAELINCGNMYYFDKTAGEYKRNIVLCTYLFGHTETKIANNLPQVTFPYRGEVFFRVKTNSAEENGTTVFKGIMYTLKDGVSVPEYGVYVNDNFRGFLEYDDDNPAFANMPLGTFIKSAIPTENGLEYFILRDEIPFYALALNDKGFVANNQIRYERRRCEYVYVLAENGNFVYVDGQYIDYNEEIHSSTDARFVRKYGYIANENEVYFTQLGTDGTPDRKVTEFAPQGINEYIRKKSVPVLRLLASGTIGEMTGIISNATIGDVIEAESDGLFAIPEVREAKISEIGTVFSSLLANMTVGNLISWSNVIDVNQYVKIALDGVTINTLLHSLEYDATRGMIVVNMLKLYGYENAA